MEDQTPKVHQDSICICSPCRAGEYRESRKVLLWLRL
jgi:hypothetical protein